MGKRETEKFGDDRVGFGVIECGEEAGDEKGKVRGVVVFDTKTKVIWREE